MFPRKYLTYGERRKRADSQLIVRDFDRLESAFLSYAQKLNKKRQEQMTKRVNKLIPELTKAHEKGNTEEVKGILATLKAPSSKEWGKGIHNLVLSSVEAGILRAHFELVRIKERHEYNEGEWTPEVIKEGYDYDVAIPKEALEYLRKHAYEVGAITEETAIRKIREVLEEALNEGLKHDQIQERLQEKLGTWLGDFHAQTIARTETGKYYNAGRVARYEDPELNGFVEAMQYDAIVDNRTTEVCKHLDGRIVSINDRATIAKFTPPNHFQCRATWLPITRYEEWKGDFDTSINPEKGFTSGSQLPKLLEGKKGPLVQAKKK